MSTVPTETTEPAPSAALSDSPAALESACARCGAAFTCGAVSGAEHCWCFTMPRLPKISGFKTCLCQVCLELALKERP
jgi:hypothetical protein